MSNQFTKARGRIERGVQGADLLQGIPNSLTACADVEDPRLGPHCEGANGVAMSQRHRPQERKKTLEFWNYSNAVEELPNEAKDNRSRGSNNSKYNASRFLSRRDQLHMLTRRSGHI